MSPPTKLRQLGDDLHARLLGGTSLTVTNEIAEIFMTPVANSLRKEFHTLADHHLIDTAVEDALIAYFANPSRFDPGRAGLLTYLRWIAKSRLLNLLAKEKNLSSPEKVVELEEAKPVYEMTGCDPDDPEDALARRESDDVTWRKLCEILIDPIDLELVKLMMEGVRETDRYAALLGLSSLSVEERAGQVKRHKDRLKKAIQRKYSREETR
jgi:DNA-directed RNA polymerase specialized sigma24 family protein